MFAHSFRFYFTGRPAHLFTFPSRYLFTIGHTLYLALEGGPPRFPQSICSMVLGNQTRWIWISRTGLSPSLVSHSRLFCYPPPSRMLVPQHPTRGFRLFRFRSPLLTESLRFLFLRVLRCFSSPSSPPPIESGDPSACTLGGLPIRKSPDYRLLAPIRRLSRPTASFFGSVCQGIHCARSVDTALLHYLASCYKKANS